jgi:hypothetical protein
MLALAGAAAVLIAVVTAVGVLRDDTSRISTTFAGKVPQTAARPAAPTNQDFLRTTPTPAAAGGTPATRRVERSAQMTLSAPGDELQKVADGIGQVASTHRGYVVSSHVSSGDESTRGGDFVLRVPTAQLEAALGELGKLGDVKARSETSQDMTAPYRHTRDRLGNLLLERRATEDKLRHATGAEADSLRARLRRINAEIDDMTSQMHTLQRRTVYSTVSVSLEAERQSGAGASGGASGAWHDALGTLSGALELAIRAVGVMLPLALVGLLAWLGMGALRRRRREAALY